MRHSFYVLRALLLFAIVIGSFVCSYCSGEVRAEEFDTGKFVSSNNFNVALEKLAEKWESEGRDSADSTQELSGNSYSFALGQAKALGECAAELRKLIKEKQAKIDRTDTEADLFSDAKQGRNFEAFEVNQQDVGQQPPPQPAVSPYTPRPEDTNGNPILIPTKNPVPNQAPSNLQAPSKVQAPVNYSYQPIRSCGVPMRGGYYVRYNNNQGVYSSGGGFFQNMRARRQARRLARGGMFGGCG